MAGNRPPDQTVALTIAGFDPSCGAGVTADLAVFAAHGVFGTAAVTALTVQSTMGVRRTELVDGELLTETLAHLHTDLPPNGVKIGMLGGAKQVSAVSAFLRELRQRTPRPFTVLDPVIRSSSGAQLLSAEGVQVLQTELLPLVDLVTPNTEELAVLTGTACRTDGEIEAAARRLAATYPGLSVLATGGHRASPDDTLLYGDTITMFRGERIATRSTHGTGCALSSALLCNLLRGRSLPEAAGDAKSYVAQAMRSAVPRGQGNGPLHLYWPIVGQERS